MSEQQETRRTPWPANLLVAVVVTLLVACGRAPEVSPDPSQAGERVLPATADKQVSCTQVNPHPVAMNIADKYNASYDDVMAWFCGGQSFEDILLALETHDLTQVPVEELLESARQSGWDQTWLELGLIEDADQ